MAQANEDARATPEDVLDIIGTSLNEAQLHAFINLAHEMVAGNLSGAGLSEARLTQIETWLAAHFVAIRDQRAKSMSISGEGSVTYQGETGMGLNATLYGQQAMMLDTSGTLGKSGMRRATLKVLP